MFYDIITYCEDTKVLVQELQEKYPDRIYKNEQTGEYSFIVNKTPTVRNGNKALCLLRLTPEEYEMIQNTQSLEILGTYDEIFTDEFKLTKYKTVWDYKTPIKYIDSETGEEKQYYKPQKFAVFTPEFSLEEIKSHKKQEIEEAFKNSLNNGYKCSNGIVMKCKMEDIDLIDKDIRLAQKLGQTQTIVRDYFDKDHLITVEELDKMATELGVFFQTMWQKKVNLEKKIEEAKNLSEVVNIKW